MNTQTKEAMRDLIGRAAKIWIMIDGGYLPNMRNKIPTVRISQREALRLIERCEDDKVPSGRLNANGQLLLRPAGVN